MLGSSFDPDCWDQDPFLPGLSKSSTGIKEEGIELDALSPSLASPVSPLDDTSFAPNTNGSIGFAPPPLGVDVFQRNRSAGPGWHPIKHGDHVRGNATRGKSIQVILSCEDELLLDEFRCFTLINSTLAPVDIQSVKLLSPKGNNRDVFVDGPSKHKYELKAKMMLGPTPMVKVCVRACTDGRHVFVEGRSVPFSIHDNGHVSKAKRPKRPRTDSSPEMESTSTPSPPAYDGGGTPLHQHTLGALGISSPPFPLSSDTQVMGNLHVGGVVRAHGFFQYSDIRLKTDIEDVADALSIIQSIGGKWYRWKEDNSMGVKNRGGMKVLGLIAQEVQAVMPEAVTLDEHGYLTVSYQQMIPLLLEGFKQHLDVYAMESGLQRDELDLLKGELTEMKLASMTEDYVIDVEQIEMIQSKFGKGLHLVKGARKARKRIKHAMYLSMCYCTNITCLLLVCIVVTGVIAVAALVSGSMLGSYGVRTVMDEVLSSDGDSSSKNDDILPPHGNGTNTTGTTGNATGNDAILRTIAFNYPSFGALTPGWDAQTPPCDWFGIDCGGGDEDDGDPMMSISLREAELTGNLPHEFGSLSGLLELNLAENQLSGVLPIELSGLSSLRELRLQKNNLTGIIPSEWSTLFSDSHPMDLIDLSENQLELPFPPWMNQEPDFDVYLSCNQWTPAYPTWCTGSCAGNCD